MQDRLAYAGDVFAGRYGRNATSNAPPLRQILEAGVPLGAGTDGTRVSSYNPWTALRWMAAGLSAGGFLVRRPENRLTRAEALHAFTIGSAWFTGDERRKGRLIPGQLAELAVLSNDYFRVADEEIGRIRTLLTITGGRVVHGTGDYASLAPPLPAVSPGWSPNATSSAIDIKIS